MKKGLIIVSLLCLSVGMMAQQAEGAKGAHPYKVDENENVAEKFSHVSLTPHIGFNYFDGDFNSEMKHGVAIPNAGLDLEYSFTPVWGMGLNYMYDMYTITGKPGANNADTLLNGHMHKIALYLSMDLINLFFPKAKKKIFSLNVIGGVGYAWYKNNKMYYDDFYTDDLGRVHNPTHQRGQTATYVNADGKIGPDYMTNYSGQFYIQGGLGMEFNLNRTMALGVRATYNYFVNDYIDGRGYNYNSNGVASKNNDGIVDVTLNMRFKLMAASKTHVRNISSLETWEKPVGMQNIHDTVIIKHDSIIIRETIEQYTAATAAAASVEENPQYYYVYFNNGKHNLDNRALITIQQVADRLQEDPELYAVIVGYCDNTGTNKLNYALGDRRADAVADELLEEHGIDATHLYAGGVGKVIGHRSKGSYAPNRRAAIRLVDKETFDRLRGEVEDKRANRGEDATTNAYNNDYDYTPVETVPLSESARPIRQNEFKQRESESVTTGKATTLAKLARKYYNNTYCWVYIYIANMDRLKNPNDLKPGTELIIPELTASEMRITKDEGLVLYNNARQHR
ncbi:MAG: OmpA family protein [Paludibacteraceae bacterium]|nr:OmpA family protein [Paludibacteraceae bacterium]